MQGWTTINKIDMKKPNVRGPSPARKAHLALGEKLNRKSKPVPRRAMKTPRRTSSRTPVYGKD
jgi:hypothetical protein